MNHERPADEESDDHERNAKRHACSGNQVIGTLHSRQQIVTKPAAGERCENSVHHDDDSEHQIGVLQGIVALAVEELGYPNLNASERKGHHRHSERSGYESRIAREAEERGPLGCLFERIELTALWFFEKKNGERQHETRRSGNIERKAPAMLGGKVA